MESIATGLQPISLDANHQSQDEAFHQELLLQTWPKTMLRETGETLLLSTRIVFERDDLYSGGTHQRSHDAVHTCSGMVAPAFNIEEMGKLLTESMLEETDA